MVDGSFALALIAFAGILILSEGITEFARWFYKKVQEDDQTKEDE